MAEAESILSSAGTKLAALQASISELENQIDELRGKLAYPDKASARMQIDDLTRRRKDLQQMLTDAENLVNGNKEKLAGVRAANEQLNRQLEGCTETDTSELCVRKNDLLTQKQQITAEQKTVHARLISNRTAKTSILKKAAEMEHLEETYGWMKALSETANGTLTGKEKIMLETYIQTAYFDRILERANIRLQKMSGGQYDLKRRRTAASMRGQSGLELDIVDHINATERSVNTLSGGEAFLASLSLALGLSDEVQMSTGIRLDTLFVDEGFGSLDTEALSKAYNTLAGLTEGNRLVGIISHVGELKEKIDRQIIVTKEKSGGSKAIIFV